MTIQQIDPPLYQSLDEAEQTRLARELADLGVALADCRYMYVDEAGKVVGAVRILRDGDGRPYESQRGVLATENVGLVP